MPTVDPKNPWKPPLNNGNYTSIPDLVAKSSFRNYLTHALKSLRGSVVGWVVMFVGFAMVPLIIKLLSALGVGFVFFELGSFALNEVFAKFQEYVGQLPPEAIAFASMAQIDTAMSTVFGGLAARLAFMGFDKVTNSSGKVKQMIWTA